MLGKYLDRLQPLGLLGLRLALGAIMIGHGYSKVFGGLHKHAEMVAHLGIPGWLGYVSSLTEFLGGALIIIGLVTRFASLAVCINMVVAIWKVHWHNGLLGQGGYQFPLSLAVIAFSLIFFGAGPVSVEWILGSSGGIARK